MRPLALVGALATVSLALFAAACGDSQSGAAAMGGSAGRGGSGAVGGIGGQGGGAGGFPGAPGAYLLAYLAEQERADFADLYAGRTNGADNQRVNHEYLFL